MSVKLRKRKNKDGTTSLLLDIYHNGERKYEFLKHLKLSKGSTAIDKQQNKQNLDLAKTICLKRAHELSLNSYNMPGELGKQTLLVDWMQKYIDNYDKQDVRNMQGALNRFKDFLKTKKVKQLTFGSITNELLFSDFQSYLLKISKGEGASSYFSRFKKMMKRAYKEGMTVANYAQDVKTVKRKSVVKQILTPDEFLLLVKTPVSNSEVRRAVLFAYTAGGLRWIDVKGLRWGNIQKDMLVLRQKKTGEDLNIFLNETAVSLLGEPGKANDLVFDLPTANGTNKTLKAWVKKAGIDKEITFHCIRHSAGTNMAFQGVDIITIGAILGHTTTKHTQRYVRAAKELKERATNHLNIDLK